MVSIGLLIFFVLLYHISEGATEGYIWADEAQRLTNPIIKGFASGEGLFGYHSWRFIENVGIIGTVLSFRNIWVFVGSWMAGYFFYERVLNFVVDGTVLKPEGWLFGMFGFEIPRYFWQDLMLLTVGVILIIEGVYEHKRTT